MRGSVELPLAADRDGQVPMTAQVAGQLRAAMTDGRLAVGERLPSTRALAAALGVSRTVVTGAYAQLFAEGWVEGRHGSGTYVAGSRNGATCGVPSPGMRGPGAAGPGAVLPVPGPAPPPATAVADPAGVLPRAGGTEAAPAIELRPGIPWARGIDRRAWRRAWRAAADLVPGPPQPEGMPALRDALTGYLRRSRAVSCGPGQILVTRGVAGSLSLIAATLLRPGDKVGIEEPGYPAARSVFAAHGAQVVPCRVDADGLVVDELPAGLRLIYTTPAHQYPLGGRLPVPRRQALIAWARARQALILEDDYDGEFRYDVAPLPALFGLDPEVVVYLGTTTKILTPALRVGWLVAQPGLVARLAAASTGLGDWAAEPAQRALHSLIVTGDLERHIRRMRHEYARRRAAMVTALAGTGRLIGDEAGMHMVLPIDADPGQVAAAAQERGVAVATLDRYYAGPVTSNGLLLGYGGATLPQIKQACAVLAALLPPAPPPGP